MKKRNIKIGYVYHDGKQGMREVIGENKVAGTVRYRMLCAKVEREFGIDGKARSLLGNESTVTAQAFTAWAKFEYSSEEGHKILEGLQAAKVKLSPGDQAFLNSIHDETGGCAIKAGLMFTYDHMEGRAVTGLEKKGLIRRSVFGKVEVLPLGAARIQKHALCMKEQSDA